MGGVDLLTYRESNWYTRPGILLQGLLYELDCNSYRERWCLQIAEWGADGIIVGSAIVKVLGEAASPKEGLHALKRLTHDLRQALLWIGEGGFKPLYFQK